MKQVLIKKYFMDDFLFQRYKVISDSFHLDSGLDSYCKTFMRTFSTSLETIYGTIYSTVTETFIKKEMDSSLGILYLFFPLSYLQRKPKKDTQSPTSHSRNPRVSRTYISDWQVWHRFYRYSSVTAERNKLEYLRSSQSQKTFCMWLDEPTLYN